MNRINQLNLSLYRKKLERLEREQRIAFCPDREMEIEHCRAMIFELEDDYII